MSDPLNDKRDGLSRGAVRADAAADGLARFTLRHGLPTERDKEIALEMACRDLVRRDARHNPVNDVRSATATPVPTPGFEPNRSGWQNEVPLAPPPGQDIIAALCDALLGPAMPKKKEGSE
jgi:hypothetical protein